MNSFSIRIGKAQCEGSVDALMVIPKARTDMSYLKRH